MAMPDYKIIETDLGPMISRSRTSVYDVMLSHKEGDDFFCICVTHNLTPVQIQVALDYIEENWDRLEEDLKEILPKKAENERYHRAITAEVQKKIDQLPMTPKRAAFYALRDKLRQERKI